LRIIWFAGENVASPQIFSRHHRDAAFGTIKLAPFCRTVYLRGRRAMGNYGQTAPYLLIRNPEIMEDKQASQQPEQQSTAGETQGVDSVLDAAALDVAGVSAALAEAEAKVTALQEEFLRAKAETENMRRRAAEDVQKAHKFAIESFAEHLLPVIDSLEAALTHNTDDLTKVKEGVELTLRQLTAALEKGRVVAINPIGEKFDPHRHQAISMVPAEQEPNTVVAVLQKGFLIADRVLRPALVTVAQGK